MKGTKFDDSGTRFTASTCGRTGSSKELGQKNGPPVHFFWREGVWTFFWPTNLTLNPARGAVRGPPSVLAKPLCTKKAWTLLRFVFSSSGQRNDGVIGPWEEPNQVLQAL